MPVVKQTNLAGGILRPHLWSRTDMPRYPSFVRRAENFYVTPTGQLANRPGFVMLGFPRYTGNYGNQPARLIPFIFTDGQNYVLEFTNLAMRVWKEGAVIGNLNGTSNDYMASPYSYSQLDDLKYAQVGDRLYLSMSDNSGTLRVVQRTAETTWSISALSFTNSTGSPTNVQFDGSIDQTGDAQHPPKEWQWKVTAWNADLTEESLPSAALTPGGTGKVVISEDKPVTISWTAVSGSSRYSIYRGRNGLYGYIGDTIVSSENNVTKFRDDGLSPVIGQGPPIGYDPYRDDVSPYTNHPTQDQWPAIVSFYQQRMVLVNTPQEPAGFFFSRLGQLRNFDYLEPATQEDAFSFFLAARQYEEVRNVVPLDGFLLILTNAGEWVAVGMDGSAMDGNSIPILKPQSRWGSSWLDPIQVGNAVVYQQDGGFPIRQCNITSNGLENNDITLMSGLPKNDPIIGWCFQRRPHSIIWGYDEWGQLYSCTIEEATQTLAWARHSTPNGKVISLCSVPEGSEDAVYACIARSGNRPNEFVTYTVERMGSRQDDNPMLPVSCYQDCSVSFNGENTNPNYRVSLSWQPTFTRGGTVTINSNQPIFAADDVGDVIVLHPRYPDHWIKLEVTSYISPFNVQAKILDDSVIEADADWPINPNGIDAWKGTYTGTSPWTRPPDDISDTVFPFQFSDWGWARTQFAVSAGVSYLVGTWNGSSGSAAVAVKADQDLYTLGSGTVTLTSNVLTLPKAACYVTLGVPYRQVIETLDIPYVVGQGVDQTLNVKSIKKAGFLVTRASQGFLIGEDPDGQLHEWRPEVGSEGTADFGPGTEDLTFTGIVETPIFNSWNRQGRIALVNEKPYPVTVCGILREFDLGGT